MDKKEEGKATRRTGYAVASKRVADSAESELLKRLGSTPDGLSNAESQSRVAQYGYNELAEKKVNPILKFLSYFWGPIPGMILIAATFIAVYGLFMTPLGWAYAGVVWGYCLGLFLVQDRVKLLAYRIFDRQRPALLAKEAKAYTASY